MNQKSLADGAYGPYVRTMNRINMEEAFHFKSGEDMVLTLMSGTSPARSGWLRRRSTAGGTVSLMFFGPADKPNCEARPPMRWRMKILRRRTTFDGSSNRFAPAALDLSLTINTVTKDDEGNVISKRPDENLRQDENRRLVLHRAGLGRVLESHQRQRPLQ